MLCMQRPAVGALFCARCCREQTWLVPSCLTWIRWSKWTQATAVTRYLKANSAAKQLVSKQCLISPLGASYYRRKQQMSVWALGGECAILIWFVQGRRSRAVGWSFPGHIWRCLFLCSQAQGGSLCWRGGQEKSSQCNTESCRFYSELAVLDKI